jgi:hypothetical protein
MQKNPGPLTDNEYEVVKQHAEWGDQLAGELGLATRVRRLIRHHHERLDGSGYPAGHVSEQINLDVRRGRNRLRRPLRCGVGACCYRSMGTLIPRAGTGWSPQPSGSRSFLTTRDRDWVYSPGYG